MLRFDGIPYLGNTDGFAVIALCACYVLAEVYLEAVKCQA